MLKAEILQLQKCTLLIFFQLNQIFFLISSFFCGRIYTVGCKIEIHVLHKTKRNQDFKRLN